MSICATAWAMRQGVEPDLKILLLVMSDCYDPSSGLCTVSTKHLAKMSVMTEAMVRNRLQLLAQYDMISTGDGTYRLKLESDYRPVEAA